MVSEISNYDDLKSEYYTLKYDIEHNHIIAPNKIKRLKKIKSIIEEKKFEDQKKKELKKELKKGLFKKNNELKSVLSAEDTYYLYDYYPISKFPKPIHPNTKLILDIKNRYFTSSSVDKVALKLNSILDISNFTICIVPSSDPNSKYSGVKIIAEILLMLNKSVNKPINGIDCIERKYLISKQHLSDKRSSIYELKKSLMVKKEDLIKGKNILLLDDVRTQGNSLESLRQLLLEKGAKVVICVALAQTVSCNHFENEF